MLGWPSQMAALSRLLMKRLVGRSIWGVRIGGAAVWLPGDRSLRHEAGSNFDWNCVALGHDGCDHNVGRYEKLQTECNMAIQTVTDQIIRLASIQPLVRSKDVELRGIPREYLLRLYRQGLLRRAARGVYALAEAPVSEHHSLAVVAKIVPHAVVCLLSALRFHGLTTQDPHRIWIAIDNKARRPSLESPTLRVVRFSGNALTEGVQTHTIEGVPVRVYSAAKTIADCFKYRYKIGIDVAVEALKDALRHKRTTIDEIHRFAKVCRVDRVMRPYLEAIV